MSITIFADGIVVGESRINSVSDSQEAIGFTIKTTNSQRKADGTYEDVAVFTRSSIFVQKGKGEKLLSKLVAGRTLRTMNDQRTSVSEKDGFTWHNNEFTVADVEKWGPVMEMNKRN